MNRISPADVALLRSLLPPELCHVLLQPMAEPAAVAEGCARLEAIRASLIPFVPGLVVEAHLGPAEAAQLTGQYLPGTIMLVELPELTALVTQLTPVGRQGQEELQAIVNQVVAALLEELETYGGDLVKFSGAALTVFFGAAQLGAQHAALACVAALAIQARCISLGAIATSAGTLSVSPRITIHSGKVFAAVVGDASHAELIVTGRGVSRVVTAQERAGAGETIVSYETLRLLDGAQVQPRPTDLFLLRALPDLSVAPPRAVAPSPSAPGWPWLSDLLRQIRALRAFLPPELPARFVRSAAEFGEFRPVTALCTNVTAFSRFLTVLELPAMMEQDTGIVGGVLNTYYARTQTVLQRYGGAIHISDMATSGDRLLALFGAPTAHEDDPVRAVQASLTLLATIGDIGQEITALVREWTDVHPKQRSLLRVLSGVLRQRIGIASGPAFAGVIGTGTRHAYAVIGETVQLAARLMAGASDGEVLLAATTHDAVRPVVELQALPPRVVTGLAQPVPAFRVVQERTPADTAEYSAGRMTALCGRRTELARVLSIANSALGAGTGDGQIVAVVGEPGIGKTRLIDEMLHMLRTTIPAAMVLRSDCQSYQQTRPYAVLARLLRALLHLVPEQDAAAQAAAVQTQLAELVPAWQRFTPLLGPLLKLPLPETDLTASLTPHQRHERLHELVQMLCYALAQRQPLVLVVDDLHWADASSLAIIQRLAEGLRGHTLLLVLAYRPTADLAEPWRALERSATIELGELAPRESEALLRALLGGQPPAEVLPLIERAHGSPLFLEETVRYLLATGALHRDALGGWVCTRSLDGETVPMQIEQLIVARLDRLAEETRALLHVAAVIGQRFEVQLLAALLPDHQSLPQRLAELVAAALVVPEESAAQRTYRFKNAMIHDVVHSSLLFAHRRELHLQVAAAIEQVYAADLQDHYIVLAQHYVQAEQFARAFGPLVQAAQQAQARYAHHEALALYQQACAIALICDEQADPPLAVPLQSLYETMGDLLALIGNYAGARKQYERLLSLLTVAGDGAQLTHLALLRRKIGGTYEAQGNLEQTRVWLTLAAEQVVRAAPSETATLEHARILSDLGWLDFRQGDLDLAQRALEQALARITPLAIYDEQSRILNRLGGVAWARGALATAQEYVAQSLIASQRSGNLVDQANALNNLGLLTESQGLLAEALLYSRQAMEINERIGSRRMLAVAANNAGYILYQQEAYQEAQRLLSQALQWATEVNDTYHQMLALLNLGRVLAAQSQAAAAIRAIQQSQFLALQLQVPAVQLDGHVVLAELALSGGDLAAASSEYEQALPLATDRDGEEYGRLQRLRAQLLFAQGQLARALELLDAAEALFRRLHNASELERSRKLRARMMEPPTPRDSAVAPVVPRLSTA